MTESAQKVSLQEFIDEGRVTARHRWLVVIMLIVMTAEGLDQSIVSHVFPKLIQEWGASIGSITTIVMVTILGAAIGAVVGGPLCDRLGRKPVIVIGMLLASFGTGGLGFTQNVAAFTTVRAIAAIGLGFLLVSVVAIIADIMPAGRRSQMMTLAFTGVTVGGIIGSLLAVGVLPRTGWQPMIAWAGFLPLVVLPLVIALLPESPNVLAVRGKSAAVIRRALDVVAAGRDTSHVDLSPIPKEDKPKLSIVFTRTFLSRTLLLWLAFFIGYGAITIVLQFLPTLLQATEPGPGFSTQQSGLTMLALSIGGLTGGVVGSLILKHVDRFRTVAVAYFATAIMAVVVALVPASLLSYAVVFFILGVFLTAGNTALAALAALTYPAEVRGTGLGGASGIGGRGGSFVGGGIGGALIGASLGITGVYLVLAAPVVICALAIITLGVITRRKEGVRASDQPAVTETPIKIV